MGWTGHVARMEGINAYSDNNNELSGSKKGGKLTEYS